MFMYCSCIQNSLLTLTTFSTTFSLLLLLLILFTGHYVAHVRNMRTGDWHTFNDRKIKPCHIPSNIIKSRDVYVLFFQRQVFARAMNRLKIPGEPLTFKEWREKLKADTPLGGGAQSGFFTSNHAIRKRPMEHEKKSF
mmetsp:Transcript_5097/g.8313  ORF Transcript_5097/g.8313 Transcript_5097/m.8313 type:complete len:138 (+) Transcript_5097:265-678(+)